MIPSRFSLYEDTRAVSTADYTVLHRVGLTSGRGISGEQATVAVRNTTRERISPSSVR